MEIENHFQIEPGDRMLQVLVADPLARFLSTPDAGLDPAIKDAIRRIAEFLNLDQGFLIQWGKDSAHPLAAHSWTAPGMLPSPFSPCSEAMPWVHSQLTLGGIVIFSGVDQLPEEAEKDKAAIRANGQKSLISLPLKVRGTVVGALVFTSLKNEVFWHDDMVGRLMLTADVFAGAVDRQKKERDLEQLKERLKDAEGTKIGFNVGTVTCDGENSDILIKTSEIMGQSAAIKNVLLQASLVAGTDSTVLIQGETGTGKELIARLIHNMSSRKDRQLMIINCAALPPTLIESELFGREKGAYTGALTKMAGRYEIADGSSIFLDEIGELPIELQGKLLRVIEEGTFERLGSTKAVRVDVRLIAATNRNLDKEVADGRFRRDLFYRLNVFPIVIPPLRHRPEDIPLLVWAFVSEFQRKMGKRIDKIQQETMELLQSYEWPGNGRELRNVIERAMIVSNSRTLEVSLPETAALHTCEKSHLTEIERSHILRVLERTSWRVTGKSGAAEILGMKGTTLQSKMKKLGILRPTSLG